MIDTNKIIKELKVGNYILMDSLPVTLLDISLGDITFFAGLNNINPEDYEHPFSLDFEYLNFIEIKKNLLLKLGFKKQNITWNDESVSENIYVKDNICIEFTDYGIISFLLKLNDFNCQSNFIKNIKYIHEIQNIYYFYTNKDLTITGKQNKITY